MWAVVFQDSFKLLVQFLFLTFLVQIVSVVFIVLFLLVALLDNIQPYEDYYGQVYRVDSEEAH